MIADWAILFIVVGIVLLVRFLRDSRTPVKHLWRRRQARIMCRQLQGRDRSQPPVVFARLRRMDPLAFEELLLECFERRAIEVVRNRRYTGDGGIDGKVRICGWVWLVQAKRYTDTIRPEHVEAFAELCAAKSMPGLFIHTGRTGPSTRTLLNRHPHIQIISGDQLLALIRGEPVLVRGKRI
ncbi:MAG: restriction endonuclease [Sphingobium sp.]|nr:restriction endonuclease [Sphingobium sp.]